MLEFSWCLFLNISMINKGVTIICIVCLTLRKLYSLSELIIVKYYLVPTFFLYV